MWTSGNSFCICFLAWENVIGKSLKYSGSNLLSCFVQLIPFWCILIVCVVVTSSTLIWWSYRSCFFFFYSQVLARCLPFSLFTPNSSIGRTFHFVFALSVLPSSSQHPDFFSLIKWCTNEDSTNAFPLYVIFHFFFFNCLESIFPFWISDCQPSLSNLQFASKS